MKSGRISRLICATLGAAILAGAGAVLFHYVSDNFGELLFGWANTHRIGSRLPLVLIVPTAGLLLIGWFLQHFPQSRAGGVREVLDALEHHEGRVPFARMFHVVLSSLVLAVGGSVGPEGPMVQLGALIGSQCGQLFHLTRSQLETLVRAGAAAGISAAFHSPAGGALLMLEIFGARFNRDLPAITIASALGYLVRTTILGDAYPFHPLATLTPLPLFSLLIVVPLLGLLAAPLGHFFIWFFEKCQGLFPSHWPMWLRLASGGATIGLIGVWFPQVLSAGYPTVIQALNGGFGLKLLVVLLLLKMIATAVSFGSGAVGGLFAPTLVIGALFGGAFGYGIHALAPSAVPQAALFVLLGMIVMFGSIVKAYWSGLLMIADLSGCYHQLLLPGVIAGGISYLISWEMGDRSIFGLTLDSLGRHAPFVDRTAKAQAGG
jgi:CIC family chloride channel protein